MSTTIRTALAARIAPLLATVRAEWEHMRGEPFAHLDAEALAAPIEAQIVRFATELIHSRAERLTALGRASTAATWDLRDNDATDPRAVEALGLLAIAEHKAGAMPNMAWPVTLAPEDLAVAYERTNDEGAHFLAASIRRGEYVPMKHGSIFAGQSDSAPSEEVRIELPVSHDLGGVFPQGPRLEGPAHEVRLVVPESTFLAASKRWPLFPTARIVAAAKDARASAAVGAAAWAWENALRLATDAETRRQACNGVAELGPKEHSTLAADVRSIAAMDRELATHAAELRVAAGMDGAPPTDNAGATKMIAGILAFDEAFAAHVEKIGPEVKNSEGVAVAGAVRKRSKERAKDFATNPQVNGAGLWDLWTSERFGSLLAAAVWSGIVAPAQKKQAALAYAVMQPVIDLASNGVRFEEEKSGQRTLRYQEKSVAYIPAANMTKPLATYDGAQIAKYINSGVKLFNSLTAHKALQYEVFTGYDRVISGVLDPRVLVIDGGWENLADKIGVSQKKANDVRDFFIAQSRTCLDLPGDSVGDLIALVVRTAKGQRRGRIEITLGTALLPYFGEEMKEKMGKTSIASREARRLVPLIGLPPFIGRANEHGLQATLQLAIMSHFRLHAKELCEHGGVLIEDFTPFADRVGLPRSSLVSVIDRWKNDGADGDNGAMFLKEVKPHRYTLGDTHAAQRAFIEVAGKVEIAASKGGKASVATKHRLLLGGRGSKSKP